MKEVLKFVFKDNAKVKYLVLFYAFIWSSTLVFLWLAQPYWKQIGLPLIYFWVYWAILNFIVSLGAIFAHKLEKKFSFKQIFIFFWICSFAFYLILYFTQNLFLALFVSSLFWFFRWLNWPIIKDYVNREVESKMRATVLSIKSLWFRIIFSILSPFVWYVADIYDFKIAFLVSAIIFAILSWIFLILLLLNYRKKCDICVK
jgi:predicted MFS family arabinose efflux permease